MVREDDSAMIASLRRLSLLRPAYADVVGSRQTLEVEDRASDCSFVPDLLAAVLM